MTAAAPPAATAPAAIVYTLRFPAPHTHYVEVEARVPTAGRAEIELMMPVWTPGSYLVREFARNVERLSAATPQGAPLTVTRSRKNRWRVSTAGAPAVVVQYGVYCREMSVRTNWVESGFALLNGGPTFVTLAGDHARPHEVQHPSHRDGRRKIQALGTPRQPSRPGPRHQPAP